LAVLKFFSLRIRKRHFDWYPTVHLFEDFYAKFDLHIVSFAFQKVELHLEDDYVTVKVVKIAEVDPKFVIKKTPILVQDFEIP